MQYPPYMAFLRGLSHKVWTWQLFMTVSTVFTLAFEIGFAFLVWRPVTRWVIIAMAVALHGGIGLFMGLKTFSLMMLTLVMSFVPPHIIQRLLRRLGRGPSGLRLYFAARSPRALRMAALVHALDAWDQVALIGQDRADDGLARLRLETADGEVYSGAVAGFRLLLWLGPFRVFYPWTWFVSPARPSRKPTAEDTRSAPSGLPEPISLRQPAELGKKSSPHIKQQS
jgi:hypothetical protein